MGLETVNDDGTARLHQLDTANPTGTDNKNQGDDHIRNIKKAIKDQFSGISGDTSSGAVTATAAELNKLDGCTATTSNLNALAGIDNIFNVIYPIGCIYESTDSTDPSTLFTGTTWTAFGQGKMLVGLDPNDTDFDSTSDSGGSKTVTLTTDQIPSHNHSFSGSSGSAGSHSHTYSGSTSNHGGHTHGFTDYTYQESISQGGDSTAGMSQGLGSGDSDNDNYPARPRSATTSSGGSHTHTYSGTTSSHSGHNHSVSGTIGNKGGGEAHDNMPPYIVVYRWKRDS